jgi:hypothetical protein
MAGITIAQAQAQLDLWLDADARVSKGQSVSMSDRTVTQADAAEITKKIEYWSGKVAQLTRASSGRGRTRYVVTE